jgi:cysteine desulfurase/selenocysteine lyase
MTATADPRAASALAPAVTPIDPDRVRPDFPILTRQVHGRPLVYLDSAATAQKPQAVLDAMDEYYRRHNANVHRGVHTLAEEATAMFEAARGRIARFVGASERATVFTKNATEAINLVAYAWGLRTLREGDEILVTEMEHHANLVPWQLVARLTGARLRAIPVGDDFRLDLSGLDELLTERTRMVALSAMSNVLGTVNPVAELAERAHAALVALALVAADELHGLALPGRRPQARDRDVQRGGNPLDRADARAGEAALDLAQKGVRQAGEATEALEREPPFAPQCADPRTESRLEAVGGEMTAKHRLPD